MASTNSKFMCSGIKVITKVFMYVFTNDCIYTT